MEPIYCNEVLPPGQSRGDRQKIMFSNCRIPQKHPNQKTANRSQQRHKIPTPKQMTLLSIKTIPLQPATLPIQPNPLPIQPKLLPLLIRRRPPICKGHTKPRTPIRKERINLRTTTQKERTDLHPSLRQKQKHGEQHPATRENDKKDDNKFNHRRPSRILRNRQNPGELVRGNAKCGLPPKIVSCWLEGKRFFAGLSILHLPAEDGV